MLEKSTKYVSSIEAMLFEVEQRIHRVINDTRMFLLKEHTSEIRNILLLIPKTVDGIPVLEGYVASYLQNVGDLDHLLIGAGRRLIYSSLSCGSKQ